MGSIKQDKMPSKTVHFHLLLATCCSWAAYMRRIGLAADALMALAPALLAMVLAPSLPLTFLTASRPPLAFSQVGCAMGCTFW